MILPHKLHSEPAPRPLTNENGTMSSDIPGVVFHPVRRASDTCPISRVPFSSECPPTSPKIHELRERKLAQLAAEAHSKPGVSK
jgi:hypothetical protein